MGLNVCLQVVRSETLQVVQGTALWRDLTSTPGVSHPVEMITPLPASLFPLLNPTE